MENLVKYVWQNALVPVPEVNSLDELNSMLLNWCEKQRQLRIKDWEQERQELRPLPSAPFKCSSTHMISVSKLLLFQFSRNYYSVPIEYAHRKLRVEAFVDRLEIYIRQLLTAKPMETKTNNSGVTPKTLERLDIPIDHPVKYNWLLSGVTA
ncbi:Mu transposase domain-containing protein [Thermanaerosceptrum fracticalcis]|uniref:Mu transposase domain-containing protein n=1 Tax=Thermanaerosceptrum fracticalcis TaxID=1712410 RepID=UPI001FAE7404|nr:hypothetical protein [Thermanaerosceptrum fracticalcis]